MTASHSGNPAALLEHGLSDALPDVMRTLLDALLSADAVCGVEYPRTRTNTRKGYRHRELDTGVGTINVTILKLRTDSCFPG